MDDSYLFQSAERRLAELPDQDGKKFSGTFDNPGQFELDVPSFGGDTRDAPLERMISLWLGTAHGTFATELLDPDQQDPSRQVIVSWQGARQGEHRA